MLNGMIFDFDGTLFDTMPIWDSVGERYLRALGKEPEAELQKILQPMSLMQSAQYLQKKYRLSSVEEIIESVNHIVEDFYFHMAAPKVGAAAFLEELRCRKIKMCIATATDRYLIEAALERCRMRHFFSEIFTCTEVGSGKDQPEIFRRAQAHLQTERTAVAEDAAYAARTAKADGFSVAAVFDKSERRQAELRKLADCYLADFAHTEEFWKFASA